jgi:hypothetical protein
MPTLRPDALEDVRDHPAGGRLAVGAGDATIGIREGAPGGKSMSTTGLAMNWGSPIVGVGVHPEARERR